LMMVATIFVTYKKWLLSFLDCDMEH